MARRAPESRQAGIVGVSRYGGVLEPTRVEEGNRAQGVLFIFLTIPDAPFGLPKAALIPVVAVHAQADVSVRGIRHRLKCDGIITCHPGNRRIEFLAEEDGPFGSVPESATVGVTAC